MPLTPLRPSDPAQVGPHRLLGRLGQGGMGTVYLGVSPDERAVAVKVLRDAFGDPDARRRFRHELDALRRVRGPHLVEVLDADVEAETPYLVTRFVPGTRLDDLVARRGPLPEDELLELARGLADALAVLHAAGVVHRDLTPGNVLVLDGQPHVIDLGLATAADVTAFTRSGLVIGTPGYLAPEQVTGSAVTAAVDVHAWGATVALAGTGRPPYGTGRPEAVLFRIVHGEPDLDGLPASLAALVTAAMHPDPARRPDARGLLEVLGGRTDAVPVSLRLPRDVDATTLLRAPLLALPRDTPPLGTPRRGSRRVDQDPTEVLPAFAADRAPERELATASSGPRATLPAPPAGSAPAGPPTEVLPVDRPVPPDDWSTEDLDWPPGEHGGEPPDPDRAGRRSPVRELQVLATGAAAVGVVGAGTLVAPVAGAVTALVLLVLLRTAGRSSDRLRDRRERRGGRRRDPVVAALGAPWHCVLAVVDTLISLPLLALAAAVPAGLVWLAAPTVTGLERPELTAATAVVAALLTGLYRRVHLRSRRMLRSALLTLTPGSSSGLAVLLALAATAVLLLATAEGSAPTWWPLTDVPALVSSTSGPQG